MNHERVAVLRSQSSHHNTTSTESLQRTSRTISQFKRKSSDMNLETLDNEESSQNIRKSMQRLATFNEAERPLTKVNILDFIQTHQDIASIVMAPITKPQKILHFVSYSANGILCMNANLQNILTTEITYYENFPATGGVKLAGVIVALMAINAFSQQVFIYKLLLALSALIKIICIAVDNATGVQNYVVQFITFFQVAIRCQQMMLLNKYNLAMVLAFLCLNMVTEYNQESSYSLRVVMIVFEVLYCVSESICVLFSYFIDNPIEKIVLVQPDYQMILLHFCELLVIIIYLGLMHNSLLHEINSIQSLVLLEIGQFVAGSIGIGSYYGIKTYQSKNGTDNSIVVIHRIDQAVGLFNAALMLFYFLFPNPPLGFICELLQFLNIAFSISKLVDYIQVCNFSYYFPSLLLCMIYPIGEFVARILSTQLNNFELIFTITIVLLVIIAVAHYERDKESAIYQNTLFEKVSQQYNMGTFTQQAFNGGITITTQEIEYEDLVY